MILHLDMDAFFASIEQMDNPELRGKPVIIGGGDRGVVATASYEARRYGVHSAMPTAQARKLCPHGIFIHGHGRRYSEISHRIMDSLYQFSPVVQKASIDEAYLDIAASLRTFGGPESLARAIKNNVAAVTGGLTCSVGIAPVKFLAKICSDVRKPDGMFILLPHDVDNFLISLPVGKLPGVGRRMGASLEALGITDVRQLRQLSRDYLVSRWGKWGADIHDKAFGIDPRLVHENAPAQSESSEHTFSHDLRNSEELEKALLILADKVAASLKKTGTAGRTITLKIKFADFRQITRSRTLNARTNHASVIAEVAADLLHREILPQPVRLLGVGVSGFDFRREQLCLPGLALPGHFNNYSGHDCQMYNHKK